MTFLLLFCYIFAVVPCASRQISAHAIYFESRDSRCIIYMEVSCAWLPLANIL